MRLDRDVATPANYHGERPTGVTRDGHEVVAISAENESVSTTRTLTPILRQVGGLPETYYLETSHRATQWDSVRRICR